MKKNRQTRRKFISRVGTAAAAVMAAASMPKSLKAMTLKPGQIRVGKSATFKMPPRPPRVLTWKLTPEQVAAIGPEPETTKA